MPPFPLCHVLPAWKHLHCFLNCFPFFLLSLTASVRTCMSRLLLWLFQFSSLALLFETGIIRVKSEGICSATDKPYKVTSTRLWERKVQTGWVLPHMNRSRLDNNVIMDWHLECNWRAFKVVISGFHWVWKQRTFWGVKCWEKLCLVNKFLFFFSQFGCMSCFLP